MSRLILFVFGSLILLLNGSGARGQGCATTLVAHFAVYSSIARDGTNIYTTSSMQGYASVYPNPGCNMNSATHRARAGNTIGGTGGSNYSGSSCPSCYFSVANNQQIVGVPGVTYTWSWDGAAICSIVGTFWSGGGGGSIPGCLVPSSETTDDVGFNGSIFREQFDITLSDTAQDSFDGHSVVEYDSSPGTNTCWWPRSKLPQNPTVEGSNWPVGTVDGVPEHNHWGHDDIGLDLSDLDDIIQNGPSNGVTFPCTITLHQKMEIECDANTFWPYHTNEITITVETNPNTEDACRDGECGFTGFSRRETGNRFEWARMLGSGKKKVHVVISVKESK